MNKSKLSKVEIDQPKITRQKKKLPQSDSVTFIENPTKKSTQNSFENNDSSSIKKKTLNQHSISNGNQIKIKIEKSSSEDNIQETKAMLKPPKIGKLSLKENEKIEINICQSESSEEEIESDCENSVTPLIKVSPELKM